MHHIKHFWYLSSTKLKIDLTVHFVRGASAGANYLEHVTAKIT